MSKKNLISKLTEMSERGEFNPSWFIQITEYMKNSEPGNEALISQLEEMYDTEEWDSEVVEKIKNYIQNSRLKRV
ncbi:hypothetical protein KY331_03320 [Candidatus Woesearchaeota archaeon]|nr:hypothetical protein [Candidatus Woesearchaeota archaeon]